MFKKILMAGLATGALAVGAPVAHAAAVQADCAFDTIAQEQVTGGQDTFTGAAFGYAASDSPAASISVVCEVRVNGGTVASTPAGASGQASVTAGQVTFTAADTDTVTLCAVWTGSESGELCGATSTQQIPPQEIIDLIANSTAVLDPFICLALQTAGVPGIINSTTGVTGLSEDADDCDLYLNGDLLIDFVPYGA